MTTVKKHLKILMVPCTMVLQSVQGIFVQQAGMLLLLMNGDHLKTILQSMTMDTRGSWMILQSHWLQKQDGIFLRLTSLMAILFRCPREESVRNLRIITVVGLMVLQQVLKILMGHFMTVGMMVISGGVLVYVFFWVFIVRKKH